MSELKTSKNEVRTPEQLVKYLDHLAREVRQTLEGATSARFTVVQSDAHALQQAVDTLRVTNETPVSPALLGNDILTCLRKCQGEHPLLRQAADALEEMTTALRLIAGADGTECAVPRVVAGRALGLQQETAVSEDRSYVAGARQAQAIAHQSLIALDKWISDGCGQRVPALNGG